MTQNSIRRRSQCWPSLLHGCGYADTAEPRTLAGVADQAPRAAANQTPAHRRRLRR